MPTSASFSTPCRDSAGRTHASQRAAGLESEGGNQRSFSIVQARTGELVVVDPDIAQAYGSRLYVDKSTGYVRLYIQKNLKAYLHRLVLGPAPGQNVDHINRNKLDNRRGNLRVCTYQQNNANRAKKAGLKSVFKGVNRSSEGSTWWAKCGGLYLGCFKTEADAAIAYNIAALRRWGSFAVLNEVEP